MNPYSENIVTNPVLLIIFANKGYFNYIGSGVFVTLCRTKKTFIYKKEHYAIRLDFDTAKYYVVAT